jgi:hypothetical protein
MPHLRWIDALVVCLYLLGLTLLGLRFTRRQTSTEHYFPWHDYMVGAIGHVVLFSVRYGASLLMPDSRTADETLRQKTLWHWLRARQSVATRA